MKILKTLTLFFALILFSPTLQAQGKTPQDLQKECKTFVQKFYDGYATKTNSLELVLRDKKSDFTPQLYLALKEDTDAQSKVQGETVGLDFDPILAAQDVGDRYIVGNVTPKGGAYWVEVFGVWNGKKNTTPDVVPELVFQEGHWQFTNFHYQKSKFPENENLLSILKVLKANRQKSSK